VSEALDLAKRLLDYSEGLLDAGTTNDAIAKDIARAAQLIVGDPLFQHKKTAGLYRVVAEDARMEAEGRASVEYAVYRNIVTGETWIRASEEFFDGRFERIETATNTGHGHVFPRPDGVRMRCGGPGLCAECSRDLARKYPEGKLNEQDEGALNIWIGHENGCVVLRFPKPVAWLGLPPSHAREVADALLSHAEAL
jgi:hypothetical protein